MSQILPKGVEKTQQLLLEAASKLFAAKGFNGTTVKDIAASAGVNVSLVSYHFNGKEGLYRTCLDQFGKERLAAAQRLLQPTRSLVEFRVRLGLFIDEIIRCHIEQPELTTMIHRERELGMPHASDIFRESFFRNFETLSNFFAEGVRAGILRDDVDLMTTPALFFGSMIHMCQNQKLTLKFFNMSIADENFQKRIRSQLLNCFVDGLAIKMEH